MNPVLLPRALTAVLVAIGVLAAPPQAGAQTALDKVSFGTNWVAEAEHGGFFRPSPTAPTGTMGLTSPSCRAGRTTTTVCS